MPSFETRRRSIGRRGPRRSIAESPRAAGRGSPLKASTARVRSTRFMRVSIQNLAKQFGSTLVLKNISLEVQDQELFFLLGPSGCGKTTLLRLIAGFYEPDTGGLFFGDKPMNGVPPHQRNTGMVFQNYALWPHMTVAENVVYGLDVRGVSAVEKQRRVAEALA